MPAGSFLIFFFALSVLSYVSNHILYRYLYMSAGVTFEDVRTYLWSTAEGNRHAHRSRNRQLRPWLEERSGHSNEFYTMDRYCNLSNLPAVLYPLAGVAMIVFRLHQYIWVLGVAMIALWAILTLLGVMYGKRIQMETADYFDSSRYQPYRPQPEQGDPTHGPYYAAPFAAADPEEAQRRRFRRGYARTLLMVIVVLVFLVLPLLSQKFALPTASTPEATRSPATQTSATPSPASDIQAMHDRLEREGFPPINAVGQLSETYPGITLSDALLVEYEGMHLEYLVLTQESQAQSLAQGLQHQLYELVAARNPDITEESGKGYTLYALETEGDYGVVVQDGTNILYAYCPDYDTTWMKWFLNDLGYLSTF